MFIAMEIWPDLRAIFREEFFALEIIIRENFSIYIWPEQVFKVDICIAPHFKYYTAEGQRVYVALETDLLNINSM